MSIPIKTIWTVAIIVVFLSMIWYVLATTAFFNRRVDLDDVPYYMLIWAPALIFNVVSIILLIKNKIPSNKIAQIVLILLIVAVTVFISFMLFLNVDVRERLRDKITRDSIQITSDEKYKYRLELVNLFISRNNHAQLYVKEISTGEEFYIPVSIRMREIKGLSVPGSTNSKESRLFWVWSNMIPSDTEETYILTTTERLKSEIEVFEIDMETMTSRRIE
ncbi:MAG: hypothetical protein LBD23_17545 [Oscillospiraceae bacterium]|jgi:hypothetical protein|nr:hypothetical protein [Oscillospiraceae bacterium]